MSWAPERERTLRGPLNICHGCGQVNALEARFCRRCETPLPVAEPPVRAEGEVSDPAEPLPEARRVWVRVAGAGLLGAAATLVAVIVVLAGSGGSRAPAAHHGVRAAAVPAWRSRGHVVATPGVGRRLRAVRSASGKPVTARVTDPVSVVAGYWRSISRHAFAAAYARLAPGAIDLSPAAFSGYERRVGVASVRFAGRPAWRSTTEAGVAVEQLVTHDARFGCRSWSGEYVVRTTGRRWQIERAAIAPHPCADSDE